MGSFILNDNIKCGMEDKKEYVKPIIKRRGIFTDSSGYMGLSAKNAQPLFLER